MLNFGEWLVKLAIEGIRNKSFNKEWAALQLANHYTHGKITLADLEDFNHQVAIYEAEKIIDGKDEY